MYAVVIENSQHNPLCSFDIINNEIQNKIINVYGCDKYNGFDEINILNNTISGYHLKGEIISALIFDEIIIDKLDNQTLNIPCEIFTVINDKYNLKSLGVDQFHKIKIKDGIVMVGDIIVTIKSFTVVNDGMIKLIHYRKCDNGKSNDVFKINDNSIIIMGEMYGKQYDITINSESMKKKIIDNFSEDSNVFIVGSNELYMKDDTIFYFINNSL